MTHQQKVSGHIESVVDAVVINLVEHSLKESALNILSVVINHLAQSLYQLLVLHLYLLTLRIHLSITLQSRPQTSIQLLLCHIIYILQYYLCHTLISPLVSILLKILQHSQYQYTQYSIILYPLHIFVGCGVDFFESFVNFRF